MLDIELGREGPPPIDAATILCLRDGAGGLEVLCVERHQRSGFLGGAIVFPGGKLDPSDRDPRCLAGASAPRAPVERQVAIAPDPATLAALAVAAARECFEEAGLLFHREGSFDEDTRRAMRARLAERVPFADILAERAVALDLARFVPFARWITPTTEKRRFDTRFYLARAPQDQIAAHDAHETTSAFWATPAAVLARFERNECAIFPPTHRSLELLLLCDDVDDAMAAAALQSLAIICPELVKHVDAAGETLALVLPGDPEHSVRESRVDGATRYVLRGEQWLPGARAPT